MSSAPRVLVVDDEPHILRGLGIILRGAGYAVETADSKEGALAMVALRPPDALLLDLVLPDGSGVEVCTEVRRWSPFVATVAFALSIPIAALHVWLDRTLPNVAQWGCDIAIAIVAVLFLQQRQVQRLYQGFPVKEAAA